MTNPLGSVFLSYKHQDSDVPDQLEETLKNHGIPLWRDISHLRAAPMHQELKDELRKSGISGAVVLLSKEVANSEAILDIELPTIHERWRADDTFFTVITLYPELDYSGANDVLKQASSLYDFSNWHMESLDSSSADAYREIAKSVLQERLDAINESIDADRPIECSLDTYAEPSYGSDLALEIDWSSYFEAVELPIEDEWNDYLLPVLGDILNQVKQSAPERRVVFRGQAHLPASFALGYHTSTTSSIQAEWKPTFSSDGIWSNYRDSRDSGLDWELRTNSVSNTDLAVLVNVTDRVEPEVGNTKPELPRFNGILEFTPDDGIGTHLSSAEAAHAATVFKQGIRNALDELQNTKKIHLFMAVPTGLAFLCGQQTNTFPPIQTYAFDDNSREYQKAGELEN
ncbi:SAVED domain-containing protein [Haloarcula amylovorans]|uniref:SAVED domain-containing protein n=1 Tax=Haloarcula amylovorans TaxID=2562280 RepID=UPI0010762433|nr:SAVED domain-containing protein [Halomicroarcula amylolytica]